MSRVRSIRNQRKLKKNSLVDIDITSLLDILVILLVFLLRSYNSSGITMTVPSGIELPRSASQSLNTPGIQIQVSKDKLWVGDKTILETDNLPSIVYDQGGRRIVPLYNELIKQKEEIKALNKRESAAKNFSGLANLIIDKSVKYDYVKKIMYTCAEAGLKEFKFIVMGND